MGVPQRPGRAGRDAEASARWRRTRDRAERRPRKPGPQPLSAGGWQCQTGGSGGGGDGARKGLSVGAGREVRPGAGGHCRVVERCEGLSRGGLGAVSRGVGRDKTDEIRRGRGRHRGSGMQEDNGRDREEMGEKPPLILGAAERLYLGHQLPPPAPAFQSSFEVITLFCSSPFFSNGHTALTCRPKFICSLAYGSLWASLCELVLCVHVCRHATLLTCAQFNSCINTGRITCSSLPFLQWGGGALVS